MKIIKGLRDFWRLEDEVENYLVRASDETEYPKRHLYYTIAKRLVNKFQSNHPYYLKKADKILKYIHTIEDEDKVKK